MSIDYDVPFYSNTPDDTHCFQAALRMVLKYFKPEEEYTWEDLEIISAKVEGLWTWPMAAVLWMQNHGFVVKGIDSFDYEKFIEHGGQYIINEYGKELGESQIQNSDITQEQIIAHEYIREVDTEQRIPDFSDMQHLLSEGYLIMCNINSRKLDEKIGYVGHFVIVKGYDEEQLTMHNPGLPAEENQIVRHDAFENAWAYPDEKSKNITAFKLK